MNKLLLVLVFTLLPIYRFITWILIFNDSELETQAERIKAFHIRYFGGINLNEQYLTLFSVVLLCFALFLLFRLRQINMIIQIILTGIISFLLLFNVWTLL